MTTTTTTAEIDVVGLIADGHLDLGDVFGRADWSAIEDIATYVACCYGRDGTRPGACEVVLESATAYGITAYRWAARDDSGTYDHGDATLDRAEAVAGGEDVADDRDETPDPEEQISDILATGWFAAHVDAADVREIIDYCHGCSGLGQGHIIVDRDGRREWVTSGYVEHEAIYLDIDHDEAPWSRYAADLLAAISDEE